MIDTSMAVSGDGGTPMVEEDVGLDAIFRLVQASFSGPWAL